MRTSRLRKEQHYDGADNIRTLTNQKVVLDDVRKSLKWLFRDARPEDAAAMSAISPIAPGAKRRGIALFERLQVSPL